MAQNLATYLHDHLAGANMAVDTIQTLLESQKDESVENVLSGLSSDIVEDRDALQRLANDMGFGASKIKDSGAYLGARAVTLKLGAGEDAFGLFEAFEFLALGILGKMHLWKALQQVALLRGFSTSLDLDDLIRRAEAQYSIVERHRLDRAAEALQA